MAINAMSPLHGNDDAGDVAQLGGQILARLVVVSNRVSVPSGNNAKRAGGLEVALRPALERNGGVWFGWSGKAVPRPGVEMHTVAHKNVTYVVTDLSEEDYQEYYNGFANRVLWPILHFRLDLAEFARRDLTGYMRVNDHFATELENGPWFHEKSSNVEDSTADDCCRSEDGVINQMAGISSPGWGFDFSGAGRFSGTNY
jgi:hypothetical protein